MCVERSIEWLKENHAKAYKEYLISEEERNRSFFATPPMPSEDDKVYEAEINECPVLILKSGNDSDSCWEWNSNNGSWQRMSDEDVPDELL